MSAARLVQQKRQEFLASVARGVAPNDSPEPPRRNYPGGSWDWEYLGFVSPEMGSRHSVLGTGDQRERLSQDYADIQYRRRHRPRRRGDMLSLHNLRSSSNTPESSRRSSNTEGPDRIDGRRRGLGSLDDDDPNILLAIQLSLQESRRERGLDGGAEHGLEARLDLDREQGRRTASTGDLGDVSLHSLGADVPSGASRLSFPTSLQEPPRPPHRTDSTNQPSLSNPIPLPPPPPSLSAELLELGDSLMNLGNVTTSYDAEEQRCSRLPYSSRILSAPLEHGLSDRLEAGARIYALDSAGARLTEVEQTASCSHEHSQNQKPNSYHLDQGPVRSRSAELDASYPRSSHPTPVSSGVLEHFTQQELQPPTQLCLPSLDLEPELLLSPVIPRGGPFTPNDPESLELLDPTASAQLLDNIMAWFNHNINPQNNPQSLALIPSPSTTESDSSPDKVTEKESVSQNSTDAAVWQPLEAQSEACGGLDDPLPGSEGGEEAQFRLDTMELEEREGDVEVDTKCVLDVDSADLHPQTSDSPAHTANPTGLDLHLDQSPEEEWEEQVHLV